MLSSIFSFWKKKCEPEVIPPPLPPVTNGSTGTGDFTVNYKVEVDTDERRNILRLRRNIKRWSYDIKIAKEELRHMRRAKTPLFSQDAELESLLFNRREQRARLLAYGYMRGKRYLQIEDGARWKPYIKRVKKIIGRGFNNKPVYELIEDKPVYVNERYGPDREAPNWDRIATIIFQYRTPNQHLLTPYELQQKKSEIVEQLRVWVGN
jgi:hypothetical protein